MTSWSSSTRVSHQSDETDAGHPGTLTDQVIEAVAEARDVDPIASEPLYEVVDPDALEGLFAPRRDGTRRSAGRVVFTLAGCEVVVHGDRDVEVTPPEEIVETPESTVGVTERERDRAGSVPERRC